MSVNCYTKIESIMADAVRSIGAILEGIELELPKHENQGDISTPMAMSLARVLKKKPRLIAEEIVSHIDEKEIFENIEIAGPGFINFTLKGSYLWDELKRLYVEKGLYFKSGKRDNSRIQVEFVSANPTGPLHLGHGRGAALGAALSNLLEADGYDVEKEFYINDAGRQVRLLGESVFARYLELNDLTSAFPEDGYHGEYVRELANEIFLSEGGNYANHSFDDVSDYFIDFAYKKMLNALKDDLSTFGVIFDSWQSEKALYEKGFVEKSIEQLTENNYIYEKDGARWFKAEELGDEKDRVVIKSNGDFTYFASDIAYHEHKIVKGFDQLINIWGADHHGYIARLKTVIKALGFNEEKLDTLLVQMVTLLRSGVPVQMSKRSGEFVTLKEVMEEVGPDITKFIFLTRRSDSHLEFDLDLVKKESSENPVFYVQYAYARINSIFKKAVEKSITIDKEYPNFTLLKEAEEFRLIKKLIFYPLILRSAVRTLEPHRITFYLQELSTLFHQYYSKTKVLTEDNELSQARLALCACVKNVLEVGLKILGISTPERM